MLVAEQREKLNYSIRPLANEDESFLWEMLYQAAHMAEEGETSVQAVRNHPNLAKYVKGWRRGGDMGFVAIKLNCNQPIGAAWLRLWTGKDKGYGYVDDRTPELAIAVLPEYRGKGVGTQLLTRLLVAARATYSSVSLSTRATNRAIHLYKQLGFRVIDKSEMINRMGSTSFNMKVDFL